MGPGFSFLAELENVLGGNQKRRYQVFKLEYGTESCSMLIPVCEADAFHDEIASQQNCSLDEAKQICKKHEGMIE